VPDPEKDEDTNMVKTFKGFTPNEPVTFELESPDGTRKIELQCRQVPGTTFLDFMSRAQNVENFGAMATAIREILEAALIPEDHEKFWTFCDDPSNGITVDVLSEIAGFISESFTGGDRPSGPRPA
jgi:hypothetical protein